MIRESIEKVKKDLSRVVMGQESVVQEILISLITGGHVLVEGVPGLAKTTLVSALSSCLGLQFGRIQFTPDLMPADILGAEFLEEDKVTGNRHLRFEKGPVFAQMLLADEINRTPPKTQAALLQAMQERSVTIGGTNYDLPFPFMVFATQNPIENEGTYPLPEAQLDRFMFKIRIDYPELTDERAIAVMSPRTLPELKIDSTPDIHWQEWYKLLDAMPLADTIIDAAVKLVRATRPEGAEADDYIKENVRWGAGPRASQYLLLAAKGAAAIEGCATPSMEHLRSITPSVLRHRIIPSFSAEAHHLNSESIIADLIKKYL
ncbi:MAG: AAA family ATPase [Planctomycetes bacterium]|nr:AAA family ATPase [Planctomycetota bacterium]